MIENVWLNALWSVVPTIIIGFGFYLILRSILSADRNERRMHAEVEAEERERLGLPAKKTATQAAIEPDAAERQESETAEASANTPSSRPDAGSA